jgi:hypothetical protein
MLEQSSSNPWVGGVLLCLTDHIQDYVRLEAQSKHVPNPWFYGDLLCLTDHIQGYVGLEQAPAKPWVGEGKLSGIEYRMA